MALNLDGYLTEAERSAAATVQHTATDHDGITGVGDLNDGAGPTGTVNHSTKDHAGITGVGITLQQVRAIRQTFLALGTALPFDNSIPQNTEGVEVLTASITPSSASSIILIEFTGFMAHPGGAAATSALFVDSTTGALAASTMASSAGISNLPFRHYLTAGSTSARTYKIRCGAGGGSAELNSVGSATPAFAGRASAVLTVTELVP